MLRQAMKILMPRSSLGYEMPDEEFFWNIRQAAKYTPDIMKIEQYKYQLFFSCDETQDGHTHNSLIEGGEYKYPAYTQHPFNYWDPENPVLPAVPMKAQGWRNNLPGYPPIARIKGEVYKIDIPTLKRLDNYKENTVQFYRERVRLIVPYRALRYVHDAETEAPFLDFIANGIGLTKERVAIIRAWMYIGKPQYWDPLISNYDFHSVQMHESNQRRWCEEYYRLRKPPRL